MNHGVFTDDEKDNLFLLKKVSNVCCLIVYLSHVMKFESLPNEILLKCFGYFHTTDLFYSFDQLNYRFNELIETLPWYLDFQHVHKSLYDVLCQHLLINSEAQKQVCSLRLSNKDTPGQINDFLSKFSLDQFPHLRSLIFIDLRENNIPQLQEIFPKLSQITTLRLLNSEINTFQFESLIPIDHLQALSINSDLAFIQKTLPLKSLTTTNLSLNEICRLLSYTPFLQYLKVSCINVGLLSDEYHQSSRPVHLKHLILTDFRATFNDFIHLLWNMKNLRSLTVCCSSDSSWVDASRWEQLITSSLPSLKHFRFRLAIGTRLTNSARLEIFERFQTDFWLKEHHWPTEMSIEEYSIILYIIPYSPQFPQISLKRGKLSNPLFDDTQTFKHVHTLVVSADELFSHENYYFPNVTSLIIKDAFETISKYDERLLMKSLNSLLNLSNIKHLEIPLNCRAQRPSLFLQILQTTPQLSSLCIRQCFFEFLAIHPETYRYLKVKIRKLSLEKYCPHESHHSFQMNVLHQSVPNLEQLQMSSTHIDDLVFLFDYFSKLSNFTVHFTLKDYPQQLEIFQKQASEQGVIVDETVAVFRSYSVVTLNVWIGRKIL